MRRWLEVMSGVDLCEPAEQPSLDLHFHSHRLELAREWLHRYNSWRLTHTPGKLVNTATSIETWINVQQELKLKHNNEGARDNYHSPRTIKTPRRKAEV